MTDNSANYGGSRVWIILGVACAAVVTMFFLRPARTAGPDEPPVGEITVTTNEPPIPDHVSVAQTTALRRGAVAVPPLAAAGFAPTAQPAGVGAILPEPTPEMRQLVNSLVQLQTTNGALTPEQAGAWRTNLAQLAAQGTAAVPAIREFLDKNTDFDFGAGGKQYLGYTSARLALIDVLGQVGGPEAIGVLSGALQVTADPREIAAIARNLEQLDPTAHRQEALDAARATLAMAAEGKLPDRDVAPLFEVLQNYGDSGVASELAQNSKQWNYYSMLALAQLPDGAGIPTLVQIVSGEDGSGTGARVPALEMLAQAAGQSDVARAALIEQARQNKLTAYNWATIQSILAGDQVRFEDSAFSGSMPGPRSTEISRTHISSGNQNFYSAPPASGLTSEQFQQQYSLIDALTSVTTDPNGLQVLQRAKAILDRRKGQG